MNTGNTFVTVIIGTLLLAACVNKDPRGTDLMPEMAQTDSVELIYFRSPDSPRYFTYLPVTDPAFIKSLISDVSGKVQPENPCMKEGKIYCFKKGQIFNTIFFAYTDPQCSFLRYIKNGKLYYFPLSESLKVKLAGYKMLAREPVSRDSTAKKE